MKKNVIKFIYSGLAILTIVALPSCLKDEYTPKLNKEKDEIKAYVSSHGLTPTEVTDDGLYIFNTQEGTGDVFTASTDYALITFKATLLSAKIFDSTDTTDFKTILNNGFYPTFLTGGPFPFSMNSNFQGLVMGLKKMHEGGKSTFIIPSTLTGLNDFVPRMYEVELIKVYHDIVGTRKAEFASDVVSLGFASNDSLSNGSYLKIDSTSMNPIGVTYPKVGDTVAVKFTGKLLDTVADGAVKGRTFTYEDSAKFIVGYSDAYVFQNIIPKMRIGMKANLYVSAADAFGSSGLFNSTTGQVYVPKYANLAYESVEFLGFVTTVKKDNTIYYIIDKNKK